MSRSPERIRACRSFPSTDSYKAALDLYVLEQRGMIRGAVSATELIRKTIKTRTPETSEL